MKLNFDGISIQNFKHVDNAIDIDLRAYGVGVHYISGINNVEPRLGTNGTGKSTILGGDALCWCLFGRTPDGSRNPDIEPWAGRVRTLVSLDLTVDGKSHNVTRQTLPNALWLDDQNVGQEEIERLIVLNFDLMTNAVILPQGEPLFLDKAPADKMEMFNAALPDLERWEQRSKIADQMADDLEDRAKSLEANCSTFKTQLAMMDGLLKNTMLLSNNFNATRQQQIQAIVKERDALRNQITKQQKECDKLDMLYDGAEVEKRSGDREINRLGGMIKQAQQRWNERQVKVGIIQADIDRMTRQLAHVEHNANCPECGQSISKAYKADLSKRLAVTRRQLGGVDMTERTLNQLNVEYDKVVEVYNKFNQKAQDARDKLDYLQPVVATAKAREAQLSKDIKAGLDVANPHAEQIADLQNKIAEVYSKLRGTETSLKAMQVDIQRYRFWVQAFKDVRLFVLDDVLSELEWVSAAMLEEIGLSSWAILYEVEKETKTGTIKRGLNTFIRSPHNNRPVKFSVWSGGEGQRLRFVGALALADVLLAYAGIDCPMEVIDEPSSFISVEGVDDITNWLVDRAQRLKRQIFYCDQRVPDTSLFTTVTTVVRDKDNGVYLE